MVRCPQCERVVLEGRWVHDPTAGELAEHESLCPICLHREVDHINAMLHVLRTARDVRLSHD